MSFGWKVGSGDTGGSAFGCVGTRREAARERYGGWEWAKGCCV